MVRWRIIGKGGRMMFEWPGCRVSVVVSFVVYCFSGQSLGVRFVISVFLRIVG